MSALRRWFRDPLFLLCLVAGLGAFAVQSGELGTSDTMHRLQTTHSWWTSEPAVFPDEYPEFGVHGRGGKLYAWYGIGQSLLLLPADVVGTYLEKLSWFDNYNGNDPSVRDIFVTYTTNVVINVFTALICFRFLSLLGFSMRQSVFGVLALLFATTHLHYTQNMMENNYIMLLTLAGLAWQYQWLKTGNRRALVLGSTALGLNLLTRLTTVLDLIAVAIFILLVLWFERAENLRWRMLSYFRAALPIYAVFLFLDRLYQWYRFGSFFNTYASVTAKEFRSLNPFLPPNYPWETPFHVGFLGPLVTVEKSIFLFDPLLLLTMLMAIMFWRRFTPAVKAYLVAGLFLLLAYICFYARYTVWSGDFAWGDRYVSTAAELGAFISVPLLLRYRKDVGRYLFAWSVVLIVASVVIQIASLAFWLPLEIYQMETLGHPTVVIFLRLKNIVAFALGKMDAWGLNNHAMTEDPWDYVHITTWNSLPFLLRHVGVAANWVVKTTFAICIACLAAFVAVFARLWRAITGDTSGESPDTRLRGYESALKTG
jgi:hypothetical protein